MKHLKKVCIFTLALYSSLAAETQNPRIQAEISYGELVDKISILQIKSERINDPDKLKNIFTELKSLLTTLKNHVGNRTDIADLMQELKKVNETLWDIEDMLRIKERIKDFSEEFVQLARRVYITNDQRFTLKKKVDHLLGSYISEEKSYESYM
jgi:hypothetical protein